MRTLVTGGGGFIGSNLVEALVTRGDQVRILDNFSTGLRRNVVPFEGDVEVMEGDLRSYERVHNAVQRCDVVFHQGALPSVPRSVQDPITTNDVNVSGTLNVVLASRDADVGRVVFASSSSIYGNSPGLPRIETMAAVPVAPYAVSKLAAESYCRSAARVYGLETVSLRYFNVFGKRQDPSSAYSAVIPKFISAIMLGQRPVIFGDGEQSRDFTHIENVVTANLLAAEAKVSAGEVLNVGCGHAHSLNELVGVLADLCGVVVEPCYEPSRPGDVRDSVADIDRAREILGYEPRVGFREGLRLTVEALTTTAFSPNGTGSDALPVNGLPAPRGAGRGLGPAAPRTSFPRT